MPSSKKNEPKFLNFITNTNKWESLKKKLVRNETASCPINTLSQLLDPSLAVPKSNVSLRSLRSKTCAPPHPRAGTSAQTVTAEIVNSQRREPINSSSHKSPADNSSSVCERAKNDVAFAVPTSRAPRASKQECLSLIEDVKRKAMLAWLTLDEELARNLFFLINCVIMHEIEESGNELSNSEEKTDAEKDFIQSVLDWFNKITSANAACGQSFARHGNHQEQFDHDFDAISSVSGYNPMYQASHAKPSSSRFDCQRSVVSSSIPRFINGYNQPGFGPAYGEENQYRYGPSMCNRNSSALPDSDNVTSSLHHNFMSRPNEGSIVGSSYHQPHGNHYGNLPSFVQNNNSMMDYPSRAFPSRMDSSFMRPAYGPDSFSNYSMMPHSTGYGSMDQMSHGGNFPNPYNVGRAPSMVGGSSDMFGSPKNYHAPFNQSMRGRIQRNILAPLQPRVVLNKMDTSTVNFPTKMSNFQSEEIEGNSDMRDRVHNLRVVEGANSRSKFGLNQARYSQKSVVDNVRDSSVLHKHMLRTNCIENMPGVSIQRRDAYNESMMKPAARSSQQAAPNVSIFKVPRKPPQTPAVGGLNQSAVIRVTRSGRAVRAPQTFWSAGMVSSSSLAERGTKRKRT